MKPTLSFDKTEKNLLSLIQSNNMPSYRQAYSNRTAWLMAALSELAYHDFIEAYDETTNPIFEDALDKLLKERTQAAVDELLQSLDDANLKAQNRLFHEFKGYEISLEKAYNIDGTQAFLLSTDTYLALVFRGTELMSFTDIKADIRAIKVTSDTYGGIHSGFQDAFNLVFDDIQNDLNQDEYASKYLYIAGHSLGGALATIAAERLTHKGGIAACYTFGAPRVGDELWSSNITPPIYRVVNAVDCVTMLPPRRRYDSVGKILRRISAHAWPQA